MHKSYIMRYIAYILFCEWCILIPKKMPKHYKQVLDPKLLLQRVLGVKCVYLKPGMANMRTERNVRAKGK